MSFVKVDVKKGKVPYILNTDNIVCMHRERNGYIVFLSSGNLGSSSYEVDEENAKIIFDAIGVYLD